MEKGLKELISAIKSKKKIVAMLAPSFVAEFKYPDILGELRAIGFDKIVELTFGAKLVNREYHKILENSKKLMISSVCPGIVLMIKKEFPELSSSLMPLVSPMIATAMICKKTYPKHKICFISPCNFKKIEAQEFGDVDFAINYQELWSLLRKNAGKRKGKENFDMFYNEFTRIYPIAGGLTKSANIKGVLKVENAKVIDGWNEISKFLKNPNKNIKFLDVTYCEGGCIGGPFTNQNVSIDAKKKKVLAYLELSKKMKIPSANKGILKRAEGINLHF